MTVLLTWARELAFLNDMEYNSIDLNIDEPAQWHLKLYSETQGRFLFSWLLLERSWVDTEQLRAETWFNHVVGLDTEGNLHYILKKWLASDKRSKLLAQQVDA